MKIAWFKKVISPEIGACLAGYGVGDKSLCKLDDLYATGLCADDGERKVLIVSFDLLGLDEWYIAKLRKECAMYYRSRSNSHRSLHRNRTSKAKLHGNPVIKSSGLNLSHTQ